MLSSLLPTSAGGHAGERLCDYVNEKWSQKSPIHLAAQVMWRLNWIQPFTDGNGRTSRALSYLVPCIRLRALLPGKLTIPEQIEQERIPHYKALEAADDAWAAGQIDLTAMKQLLASLLANNCTLSMRNLGPRRVGGAGHASLSALRTKAIQSLRSASLRPSAEW